MSSVEVIGAGAGRTGTNSLKMALEILGYNPCYHMKEVMFNKGHPDFWVKVANKEPYDFAEAFGSKERPYTATCDFPSSTYWKEQLDRYPDAKVILTIRDPEKWYKSAVATIFLSIPTSPWALFGIQVVLSFMGKQREMLYTTIARDFFHFKWDKQSILDSFNAYNAKVISECPKDKLLVFEVSQGWEPLCKFLDKPIPKVPFPNVNDTKEFQKFSFFLNRVGLAIVGVAVSLPIVGALYYFGGTSSLKSITWRDL